MSEVTSALQHPWVVVIAMACAVIVVLVAVLLVLLYKSQVVDETLIEDVDEG